MSEPLQVKIMRDKQEIASYPFADLLRLLADGTLRPTDHYWHKGMLNWVKLSLLQEQEQAKAKASEDLLVAEAVKIRMELERKEQFHCNCCRSVFKKPDEISRVAGFALIIGSLIGCFFSTLFLSILIPIAIVGFTLSFLLMVSGFCVFMASLIRSPDCPNCGSTNFAKPE